MIARSHLTLATWLAFTCFDARGAAAAEGASFRLLALPGPWPDRVTTQAFYDRSGDAEVASGGSLGIHRGSLTATAALIGNERDTLLMEVAGGRIDLDAGRRIRFPDSGTALPDRIDSAAFGITGRHIDTGGRRWVASVGVHSRSDDLENDDRAIAYRVFGGAFLPTSKYEGWTLGLNYVSTSDYPLPLVAYTWVPDPRFRAMVGLPFFS